MPVGSGLHGAEYDRGDVSGDSEFYVKNQGKIVTACSFSLTFLLRHLEVILAHTDTVQCAVFIVAVREEMPVVIKIFFS